MNLKWLLRNIPAEKGDMVSKFIKRTISTVLLLLFVALVVYIFPNWLFCLVITGFVAFGLSEFFKMIEKKDIFVYKYFGTAVGSLIPIVVFMGNAFPDLKNLVPILIIVGCLFAFIMQFIRRDEAHDHLISMALTLFALFYVGWFFSFFVKIKMLTNGANLIAFLILITKGADMGAYVIGSRFGKSELIPRISPNKTKEGTIGGILVSVVLALALGRTLTGFSFPHLFALALILSVLGQIGDLAESLIKRDYTVKDSGNAVAGIGGVLDLVDSLLFTAPAFYFYIKAF